MKVTVIYNQVDSLQLGKPEDVLADQDTVKTAEEIVQALKSIDFTVDSYEVNEKTASGLLSCDTNIFFNNGYGIGNTPKSESDLAVLLSKSGKPYTGSDAKTLTLTLDKTATKDILIAGGILTPKFQVFTNHEDLNPELRFPLIVKPNNEDCSLGLSGLSVVENEEDLRGQIEILKQEYSDPVLVEEYIAGRELNVTVLGNGEQAEILPVSEIVFGKLFPGKFQIVDFTSKWKTETLEYKETTGVCPASLDPITNQKVNNAALAAFNVTRCHDYARIDMRLTREGEPYVLEVNANPGIGLLDGATRSARAAGYSYPEFLKKIIDVAIKRFKNIE